MLQKLLRKDEMRTGDDEYSSQHSLFSHTHFLVN